MHATAGPGKNFKSRRSEMRFHTKSDGTILAQNDIELICEAYVEA
jgi:hypothetical protein